MHVVRAEKLSVSLFMSDKGSDQDPVDGVSSIRIQAGIKFQRNKTFISERELERGQ